MNRRMFLASVGAVIIDSATTRHSFAASPTIQLTYFNNYPPFSWQEDGNMKGMLIDLLSEALENRMGIPTSHAGYPWRRAQLLVKSGQADAFCTVPTPERREYANISDEPTLNATFTLFIKRGTAKRALLAKVTSLDELQNFRIGHYLGSGWAKKNLKGRGFNLFETTTLDGALRMLAIGRTDLVIDTSQVVRYRIKELGLSETLEELPQVLDQASFSLCIGKASPFVRILSKFEKTMRAMRADGIHKEISGRYA